MVTIKVRENGPYQVVGDLKIVDGKGEAIPLPEDGKVFLCRCGHSGAKPFCDGAHKVCGFVDPPDTVIVYDPKPGRG